VAFLKNSKQYLKVLENLKINIDVDNGMFYQPEKNQLAFFYIRGCTKNTKSDGF
jgi:hypothetical protein